ncbi:MAG: phosphoribosylanthranilate isomerase [Gammaproteobacteria bacterium]|nr:phosphoribosylanthranilate isomerase [Gammaproteobacteria bacterium]HXK57423.1 phosphoribosylanthranilate isomerase [Gammaproteobacteria bacterium]
MRTRIKICGITRRQDAAVAVREGADAVGLVFYPRSPRAVSPQQAAELVRTLPPFISVVGLFVNAQPYEIERVLAATRIDLLQFHGDETAEACSVFNKPYIKAIRMRERIDLYQERIRYRDAAALLLDTYRKGVPGGTGDAFDWDRIPSDIAESIILAGGLTPDNVERAIRTVRPYAVDVSGGVEREKGIKDEAMIAEFIRGVERADNQSD